MSVPDGTDEWGRLLGTARRRWQWLVGVGAITVVAVFAGLFVAGLPPLFTVALVAAVGVATALVHRWRMQRGRGVGGRALAGSAVIGFVVVAVLAQAVPYGRSHSNPPVIAEPAWDSLGTRELVVRACFDCHSNEVDYPWYANVAPFSWAVALHVSQGRDAVNYSEWGRGEQEADESAEEVRKGSMPPPYFTRFTHAKARLSAQERAELIAGLEATFGSYDD